MQDKYVALKTALLAAFGKSQAQKDAELLSISGLGDLKLTALLRHLELLNNHAETLRRAFFLAQLPTQVRAILALQSFDTLHDLALAADRIIEAGQLDAYCTGRGAANTVASAVPRKYSAQSRAPKRKFICLYHQRFGPDARNCRPGCMFANVLTTQHLKQTLDRESRSPMTSAAGDLARTNTLSVWDRTLGQNC